MPPMRVTIGFLRRARLTARQMDSDAVWLLKLREAVNEHGEALEVSFKPRVVFGNANRKFKAF